MNNHILYKHGLSGLSKALFSASARVKESAIAEKVIHGAKNRNFDKEISMLLKVSDARAFYYSRLPSFQ
jgi:hypothetical protein